MVVNAAGQLERVAEESVEAYGARARACAEYGVSVRVSALDAELDWREWTDQQDKRRGAVTLRARPVLFGDALEHRQR